MPYSGPASAYGVIGRTWCLFSKLNAEGGINGRKVTFISSDDALVRRKTIEQTRKLVESDEVLLIFQPLGTPQHRHPEVSQRQEGPAALRRDRRNERNDPQNFPWTMGWQPNYQNEARIYAKYILKEEPECKIAVLYQNDDYGKDYSKAEGQPSRQGRSMIVAEDAYEAADPTIDSQIIKIKSPNADIFVNITSPKFAAQAISKKLRWAGSQSISSPTSPFRWAVSSKRPELKVRKGSILDLPQGSDRSVLEKQPRQQGMERVPRQTLSLKAQRINSGSSRYSVAQTLVQVLKPSGDDLTRENVMQQAANLKGS